MRPSTLVAAVALVLAPAVAQESGSYRVSDHVLNAGGHPAQGSVLASTTYRVRLDAIGESTAGLGLRSASYRAEASFTTCYPPPGEVTGLRFTDDTTLVWDAEPSVGTYALYRDTLGTLAGGGYGACLHGDVEGETASDAETPSLPGSGFFYLATARNRIDEEGTKGRNSADEERPNAAPCP